MIKDVLPAVAISLLDSLEKLFQASNAPIHIIVPEFQSQNRSNRVFVVATHRLVCRKTIMSSHAVGRKAMQIHQYNIFNLSLAFMLHSSVCLHIHICIVLAGCYFLSKHCCNLLQKRILQKTEFYDHHIQLNTTVKNGKCRSVAFFHRLGCLRITVLQFTVQTYQVIINL